MSTKDYLVMRQITLATASVLISTEVPSNGFQIRGLMIEAKKKGARLLHLPEGALSGYAKSEIKTWSEVDWNAIAFELHQIKVLAKRLCIWVVLGCNHVRDTLHLPFNSMYIISDAGEIADRYDKRFCSYTESNGWYTAGNLPVLINIDGYCFGFALCIEIQFPELFLEYNQLGADCVLFSAYSRDPIYGVVAQAYAATNNLWVSLAVPSQCTKELPLSVFGPDGSRLSGEVVEGQPPLIITTINRDEPRFETALKKARPWRNWVREKRPQKRIGFLEGQFKVPY
jgi:deaminated glutathione amidase